MLLHLRYFALLREERGLEEESIDTHDTTPASLYETLRVRHGFSLPRAHDGRCE